MLAEGLKFCSECGANLLDSEDDWSGAAQKPSRSEDNWSGAARRKPSRYEEPEYEEPPYQKPRPPVKRADSSEYSNEPQRIVIEHARKKGDDISTSFGRGFGDTIGRKAGGCVWTLIVVGVIILLIAIVTLTMQ
jgi:hypothetical protein